MNSRVNWLWYWGLLHYLGKAVSDAQSEAGWALWESADYQQRKCVGCGKFVKRRDRSIDHIIPKSICWELGLYRLVVDSRNFRIMHKACNINRSSDTSDLPASVLAKLKEIGYANPN